MKLEGGLNAWVGMGGRTPSREWQKALRVDGIRIHCIHVENVQREIVKSTFNIFLEFYAYLKCS